MNDPIVAEVRKFRDEHARAFNYDLDAICADLMASQRSSAQKGAPFDPSQMDLPGANRKGSIQ